MRCKDLTDQLSAELAVYVDSVLKPVYAPTHDALSCALQTMQAAFDTALSAVKTRINELALINRLPDDIMMIIFRAHPAPFPLAHDGHANAEVGLQAVVARVCRRWHDIVMSDPSCWDDICVNAQRGDSITALSTLLSRTKSRCVDVSVCQSSYRIPPTSLHLAGLMKGHIGRIQRFSLKVMPGKAELFDHVIRSPSFRPQQLHIDIVPSFIFAVDPVPVATFLPMGDRLEVLMFRGMSLPQGEWNLPLLHHVDISCAALGGADVSTVLSNSPVLRTLRLVTWDIAFGIRSPDTVTLDASHTLHMCLESLELVGFSQSALLQTLVRVRADALNKLHLTCCDLQANTPLAAMILLPRTAEDDQVFLSWKSRDYQLCAVRVQSPRRSRELAGMPDFAAVHEVLQAASLGPDDITDLLWAYEEWRKLREYTSVLPRLRHLDLHVVDFNNLARHNAAAIGDRLVQRHALESISIRTTVSHVPVSPALVLSIIQFIDWNLDIGKDRLQKLQMDGLLSDESHPDFDALRAKAEHLTIVKSHDEPLHGLDFRF